MDNSITQIPFSCILEKMPSIEHYKIGRAHV